MLFKRAYTEVTVMFCSRYCLRNSEGEMVTLDLGLIIHRNEVVVVRRWAGGMLQGRVT